MKIAHLNKWCLLKKNKCTFQQLQEIQSDANAIL
jgi:hypothetical protein